MTRRSFLAGVIFGLFGPRFVCRLLADSIKGGRWYPGIIHVHSTFSDGDRTPAMLKNAAVANGLAFLIVTDHWEQIPKEKKLSGLVTDDFGFDKYLASFQSTPKLIIIAAAEIAVPRQGASSHVLAIGDLRKIIGQTYSSPKDLIENLSRAGLLAVAAHPDLNEKGRNFIFDLSMAPSIAGIEFYNQSRDADRKTLGRLLDLIAAGAAGRDIFVTSGCDSHMSVDPTSLDLARWTHKTYVWVEDKLTDENLLAALANGRTYAANDGAQLVSINHLPGFTPQSVNRPEFFFTISLPDKASWKKAKLYRDGQFLGFAAPEKTSDGQRYHFHDTQCSQGTHRYIIEIEDYLVTSPIILDVKDDSLPRVGFGTDRRDRDGLWPERVCRNFLASAGTQLPIASNAPVTKKTLQNFIALAKKAKAGAFGSGKVYEIDGTTRCDVHVEVDTTNNPLSKTEDRDHSTWILVLENNQWKIWDIVEGYVNW